MTTRAVCVGVNDYPIQGADLQGCVNDAKAWATLLVEHFGAKKADVTMLLDGEAKHDAVLAAVDAMLAASRPGDVAVFTNSSHGTYVADSGAEEADHYDEAMCPWDIQSSPLIDDELRTHLDAAPDGVHVVVISDSCHSGTGTRAFTPNAVPRYLPPRLLGHPELPDAPAKPKRPSRSQASMTEVYLAGCRSDQYSYDAKIGDSFHGAMTFHAVRLIEEAGYDITWTELHDRLVPALKEAGYDQEPRLEGKSNNKGRKVFR